MAKSLIGALALASLPSALAFRNSSPFFLYSTADLNIPSEDVGIARLNHVNSQMTTALESCPTKTYFVVRQDGVSSADFLDSRSAPQLALALRGKNKDVKSSMIVSEVLESKDTKPTMGEYISQRCGAELLQAGTDAIAASRKSSGLRVVEVSFPPLPLAQRAAKLGEYDSELEKLIADIADSQDYTVVYTTTPPTEEQAKAAFENQHTYEMEDPFGGAVQMELKRDLSSHKRAASNEGGLFERYQYFSPALFMGFAAITPLFLIIFVGLKALSSLEVSYFAFSKEMGPAAQRKQ